MNTPRSADLYRWLLRVYPRRFRHEYGPDMVLLFADQLRDEPALRVWLRVAVDLVVTAPARHLEAHMNRPPNSSVPLLFAAVSVAGALIAIIGGSAFGTVAVGLVVAALAGATAILAWRRARPVAKAFTATEHWWKLLAGGAAALLSFIVVTTITGELSATTWMVAMIVLFSALVSLAGGVVLGVARVTAHRHASHPGI